MAASLEKSLTLFIAFTGFHFWLIKGSSSNDDDECVLVEKYEALSPEFSLNVGECQATSKSSAEQATVSNTNCVPRKLTEERHLLYKGHHVVTKVTIQSCQKESAICQRHSRFVSFYPGKEYSRTIDVGVCGGHSERGMTCKAISTESKAISTPAGDRCIPVVLNCSSVNPYCHRESNLEGFRELYKDSEGKNVTRTRLVDMGKCISENMCPVAERSNFPSSSLPFPFPLFRSCMAETYTTHSFVSTEGHHVNISAIATCSCQD